MLHRSTLYADPLSDALSLLRPRNVACGAIDAGDASVAFPAGRGIKCHAVTAGEAWLAVDGVAEPLHLVAGDCFILPHGRPYRLASDLSLAPIDYQVVLEGRAPGSITTWNGGGRATIISAAFTTQGHHAGLLLGILPAIAHVRDEVDRPALRRSLHQMMDELRAPQPGSRLIVEYLATMMLAQVLRAYASGAPNGQVGWLYALADRRLGAAIGAMHEDPSHRWTVQALADRAGMSRTSFAVRFKTRVGTSPMSYLTRLRVLLASDRLVHSEDAIGVVAEASGYRSESAFSHAFKREMGHSPRLFATGCLAREIEQ